MNRRAFFKLLAVGTAAVYLRLAPEKAAAVPTGVTLYEDFENVMDRIFRSTRLVHPQWVLCDPATAEQLRGLLG